MRVPEVICEVAAYCLFFSPCKLYIVHNFVVVYRFIKHIHCRSLFRHCLSSVPVQLETEWNKKRASDFLSRFIALVCGTLCHGS